MLNIQQLSQELNLGVDTLRIWERRYGVPCPVRDTRGRRQYPDEQVEELRLVAKLLHLGLRPKMVFGLTPAERQQRLEQLCGSFSPQADLLELCHGKLDQLDQVLRQRLEQEGLRPLIRQLLQPFLELMGREWEAGRLSIAQEHLLSDVLMRFLRGQLMARPEPVTMRLLFLTLNGERHKLGLLLAAVLFQQAGADCLLVEEEIPLSEVSGLVNQSGCHAVAVSFSAHYPPRQVKKDLIALREALPPHVGLVAGGQGIAAPCHYPAIVCCCDLDQIPAVLERLQNR
ncbi:MAG: MerR family transcriptional regulator [Desulfuromonadaceae bacterium]|nr:MerR family transcriptional regulator [Desulfuromonadaceae bacterium]